MNIVVIDDEELIVKGLISMISEMGLPLTNVDGFQDSSEAIEHILSHHTDIICIDICMPKVNGIELISRINTDKPAIKSVILSGYQEFTYAQKAIQLKVLEYLIKPINPADLERILKMVFQQVHSLTPSEYRNIFPGDFWFHSSKPVRCSNILLEVLRYIDKYIFEGNISLTVLSDYTNLSPSYISRMFERELGISYSKYIEYIRLNKAITLLTDKELPITEIAKYLGYSNERQFYRLFKNAIGITPNQYRMEHR